MSNYPFSIEFGNPELIPEDVHSIELNHSKYWKSTSLYTNIYYRQVNDVIRHYSFLDEEGVLNETSLNYASGTNYGVDLTVEQTLNKWWRVNANGNFYRNITKGSNDMADASLNTEGYSYSARLNSTMNLPKNIVVQFTARFNGPRFRGQTEMKPNWGTELAIRKSFNKNKWSVGLRLSDMFNTQKWDSYTYGADFETDSYRKMLTSRALYLSVSYKINQGDRPKKQAKRGLSVEGEAEGGGGEE
jgi:outer membrane cobalamin receptor